MAEDNWKHRSDGMRCLSCMYFVPKVTTDNMLSNLGRCRGKMPTMRGWVPVFAADWCGEHRLDENKV